MRTGLYVSIPLVTSHLSHKESKKEPATNKRTKEQCLVNLSEVLLAAGSSIDNVVKVNIFITNMENFAAMNNVYAKFFNKDPKPVR